MNSVLKHRRAPRGLSDQAFLTLYRRVSKRSLVYLTRKVCDPEIAADLWAETWAVAFEERTDCRAQTDEGQEGWLYAIARRRLATYYRSGEIEKRAIERVAGERPLLGDDDAERLEELAALERVRSLVREALDSLPSKRREALRLRIVEERSYAEVAAALGCSEQTARARVARGVRALRDTLEIELPERQEA